MGRLKRHLDEDLIDRMEAGWTPTARTKPAKKQRTPRVGKSYRAAKRNAAKGTVWEGCRSYSKRAFVPPVCLNRSKKWDGVPLSKPYR